MSCPKTLLRALRPSAAAATLACLLALVGAGSAGAATHRHVRVQIVGGQPVPAGAFPQLAYIVNEVSSGDVFSCTGTVLSANVVLTAAHCAENLATGTVDPAGGFSVTTGQPNLAGVVVGHVSAVSNVIVYPLYESATHDWDAALLELSTPTSAPPVTLATSADAALWQSGTEVAIAGWGLTDGADPNSQPAQVQWATTQTQSAGDCMANAALLQSVFDAGSQICTIDTPADQTGACHGDSGGPLLARYWTATPIEVGITVWGQAGCQPTYADFFTQTAPISSWAETWVNNLSASPVVPASTPTPASAPTPTSTRRMPRAGTYRGHSSQNHPVELTVTSSATSVSSMAFAFRLHCSRGRHRSDTLRTRSFAIHDLAFGGEARTHGGGVYTLAGRFNTTGAANGTMTTNRRSARYGNCHSGVIHWKAKW